VALLSSGDEIVDPHVKPSPGQVRDVNGSALAALVTQSGGLPDFRGIVPDEPGKAETAARTALSTADALVITAGSSDTDLTASAIAARRSASWSALTYARVSPPSRVCDGKAVIGLPATRQCPGNRQALSGSGDQQPGKPTRSSPNLRADYINLASQAGREDWWASA
jgi:molybdopterin biosynthesis enzyme